MGEAHSCPEYGLNYAIETNQCPTPITLWIKINCNSAELSLLEKYGFIKSN